MVVREFFMAGPGSGMTDLEALKAEDGRIEPGGDNAEPSGPEQARERAEVERRPWLSPMNQRRLDNFRRNRRGAWSLWIFLVLFVGSLFAEFIANDRPLIASYKGEILFPVLFNYPEDKFGGFEARADFRGSFVANEVNAHGWMIWPPIRFANSTTILNPPTPLPSPPTWMLSEAQCRAALEKQGDKDAAAIARPCRRSRAAVARLRSGRARHRRAPHLRLPHLDSVRSDAGRRLVGDRRRSPARCRAISAAGSISRCSG